MSATRVLSVHVNPATARRAVAPDSDRKKLTSSRLKPNPAFRTA
jgi:hypothetical protein